MKLRLLACMAALCLSSTLATAQTNVLLLDYGTNESIGAAALSCLGITPTVTTIDDVTFSAELSSGTAWDLIVVDNPCHLMTASEPLLEAEIVGGTTCVVMSYWAMDGALGLQAAMGIGSATDIFAPEEVLPGLGSGTPTWTTPNDVEGTFGAVPVGPGVSPWFDNGDYLTLAGGSELGVFPGGQIAIAQNAGGNAIHNAFDYDSMNLDAVTRIVANEINLVCSSGATDPCPAPGDACAVATTAVDGPNPFDTTGATDEGTVYSCGAAPHVDVWFVYTPICDGDLTIDTLSADYDTTIAAFDGCGGTELGCNDDEPGGTLQSQLTIPVTAGVPVWVSVGGFLGDVGTGDVTFTLDAGVANDFCADAIDVTAGVTDDPFTTLCATEDGVLPSCGGGTIPVDIWYCVEAMADTPYRVDTIGSGFDTRLAVYTGDCGALAEVICNDDAVGLQSELEFTAMAGVKYYIQVCGFNAATGMGDLTVTPLMSTDVTGLRLIVRGELGGGLIDDTAFHEGLVVGPGSITIEAADAALITGTPSSVEYVGGSFPDNTPLDAFGDTIAGWVQDGVPAWVSGGDIWGFDAPTGFNAVDGVAAGALDGDDGFLLGDGLDSGVGLDLSDLQDVVYTQDQGGNDWTDQLFPAGVGEDTLGDNTGSAFEIDGGGYNTIIAYATETIGPAEPGNVVSQSVETAGLDGAGDIGARIIAFLDGGGGPGGDVFARGDANQDNAFDISDAVFLLSALFVFGSPLPACDTQADANDDDGVDISDAVYILSALFVFGSPAPVAPYPACGTDPTPGTLDCANPPMPCVDL